MRQCLILNAIALVLVALAPSFASAQDSGPEPVLGPPPGSDPVPFLPELFIDGAHSAPAFTPDGAEVYWSRYYTPEGRRSRTQHIFHSRTADGQWTAPELASFSGDYSDGGPFITGNGSRLFFYSNRPAQPGGQPSDEFLSDIWFMDRTESGWGEPQRLGFNTDKHEGAVSVADDGTIYFQSNGTGTRGIFDIYSAEPVEGGYAAPKNLGRAVNCPGINFSPLVAPDQSYLILAYNHNEPNNGLYISFHKPDGGWTKAISMGEKINVSAVQRFPGLSPDGRYLFFVRAETTPHGMHWVDASFIDELKKTALGE